MTNEQTQNEETPSGAQRMFTRPTHRAGGYHVHSTRPLGVRLPEGGLILPSAPNPTEIQDADLISIWTSVPVFPAARPPYLTGHHALILSFLFADPRLGLAAMLSTIPEAFYGRLATPILDQLPPGSEEIYERFCSALQRALFKRYRLEDVTLSELDLVIEREAVVWNRANFEVVLQGTFPRDLDEETRNRLQSSRGQWRQLRDSYASGRLGEKAMEPILPARMIRDLFDFRGQHPEMLGESLRIRLFTLQRDIVSAGARFSVEPELAERIGTDEVLNEVYAYPGFTPEELDQARFLAAPPALAPDRGVLNPGRPDAEAFRAAEEDPRLRDVVKELHAAAQLAHQRTVDEIHRRAEMVLGFRQRALPRDPAQDMSDGDDPFDG